MKTIGIIGASSNVGSALVKNVIQKKYKLSYSKTKIL